jgi:hypothetical protein
MKSFKQFINEQLSLDDLDDLDDFGDDFGDDLNLFPDSLSNLEKLSEKDIMFYKNLIMSDLEYDNELAESGLNNEGIAIEDFIELAFSDIVKYIDIFNDLPEATRDDGVWVGRLTEYFGILKTDSIIQGFKKYFINYKILKLIKKHSSESYDKAIKLGDTFKTGYTDMLIRYEYDDLLTVIGTSARKSPLNTLRSLSTSSYITLGRNYNISNEVLKKLFEFSNIKDLDLSNIGLKRLPSEIGNLINLEILNLKNNYLKKIPIEVFNLINLRKLRLSDADLYLIPKEIGQLTNLEVLGLASTKIAELPSEIGNLINLKKLNLDFNFLTEGLPPEIGNLINLEQLSLRNTELTELPPEISNLKNLKTIAIDTRTLSDLEYTEMRKRLPNTKFRNYF